MLSRLLKYEIKATGRVFLPLFLALLAFAGITRLIALIGQEQWGTPEAISMLIYGFIMAAMFVMTFITMIQRFYRNLLADEGYLMHTLPVKPWQHIVAKLLVSMFWIVVSGIVAFISILILALKKGDLRDIVAGVAASTRAVFDYFGNWTYLFSLEMLIGGLLTLASGILLIYASIAIGHLFRKHKMLASFGAFIGLNTLSQILFLILIKIPGITPLARMSMNSDNFQAQLPIIQEFIIYGIALSLLICAIYFAVTQYILSKRLNLE